MVATGDIPKASKPRAKDPWRHLKARPGVTIRETARYPPRNHK